MITYHGSVESGRFEVWAFDDERRDWYELTHAYFAQLRRPAESCQGFSWGYLGAGSHCLAGSLLCDVTANDYLALILFQEFASGFLRDLPQGRSWKITSDQIETWIGQQMERTGVAS